MTLIGYSNNFKGRTNFKVQKQCPITLSYVNLPYETITLPAKSINQYYKNQIKNITKRKNKTSIKNSNKTSIKNSNKTSIKNSNKTSRICLS